MGDTQLVVWQDISLLGTANYLSATEVSDVVGSVVRQGVEAMRQGPTSGGTNKNSWCYFGKQNFSTIHFALEGTKKLEIRILG